MAVALEIQYIAYFMLRELGLGTYVPLAVSAGSSSIRVLNAEMFEPAGGQLVVEATDNVITYTGVQADTLVGVPETGTGSLADDLVEYTEEGASILYIPTLVTTDELETVIDRYRTHQYVDVHPIDGEKKHWRCRREWLGEDVELRDSMGATYNVITPDDDDSETGEFDFDSARSESLLYAYGPFYNPWFSIADVIESLILSNRWSTYLSVGQIARVRKDPYEIAKIYRRRGSLLESRT